MNIAVFSDLHGYLHLCFKLCNRWEKETGERIDVILQTGDMGIFPDESWLDWPTRRHAQRDPEELGFLNSFARYDEDVAATLQCLKSDLIFIRGNHEAHSWLDQQEEQALEPLFAVDVYQRLYCLKSGVPYTFSQNGELITLLGIGRIAAREGKAGGKPAHLQAYELTRLLQLEDQRIDVLLTHDSPYGLIYPESGLHIIQDILGRYQPLYHFFGHYIGGQCLEHCYLNRVTHACKLAEPHFDRRTVRQTLLPGCMGMLRWSHRAEHHFEIIDAPWLSEYNPETWRAL